MASLSPGSSSPSMSSSHRVRGYRHREGDSTPAPSSLLSSHPPRSSFLYAMDESEEIHSYAESEEVDTEEKNPFSLPQDDEEIFILKEHEKNRRMAERRKKMNLPIHQKMTETTRMTSVKARTEEYVPTVDEEDQILAMQESISSLLALNRHDRRHDTKDMRSFLEKKRQMFLVQYSLDTKRKEIEKLEQRARRREKKLEEDEKNLRVCNEEFEKFLEKHDQRAMQAVKNAEKETQEKQNKVKKIRRLANQVAQLETQNAKDREKLKEYLTYKNFLDSLAPIEFRRALVKRRLERKATHDAAFIVPPDERIDYQQELTLEDLEDYEDEDMFFSSPQDLLEKFTDLEEDNLNLIRRNQELEELLEKLKRNLDENQKDMNCKIESLSKQIEKLEGSISNETSKTKNLEEKASKLEFLHDQRKVLDELQSEVLKVYVAADFERPAHPDTLAMLNDIEQKLENLLVLKNKIPKSWVQDQEKMLERKRREEAKRQQKLIDEMEQASRAARFQERSEKKETRKPVRPVMKRSHLPEQKRKQEQKKEDDNKEEMIDSYIKFLNSAE